MKGQKDYLYMSMKKTNINLKISGFTIVELLVVIVVIGVLAAITMVSYSGITQKAKSAVLQSDIKSASTILEMDKTVNGKYPDTAAAANGGKGLPKSEGTNYDYTSVDNGQGYQLIVTGPDATTPPLIISPTNGGGVLKSVRWQQVTSASDSTCALTTDGDAYCWGWNTFGNIGNGTTSNSSTPLAVNMSSLGGKKFRYISTGSFGPCAISTDNQLYCWGLNMTNGQNVLSPLNVSSYGALSGKTISTVSGGIGYGCAVDTAGLAYCWGGNSSGEVGDGTFSSANLNPKAVYASGALSGKTISKISVGYSHTCVIASDNKAYCWGENDHGQLGNNLLVNSNVPVAVDMTTVLSGKTIKEISVRDSSETSSSCAIASDDNLYCWGENGENELGNGTYVDSSVPVVSIKSGDLTGKFVKNIDSSGIYSTCLLATDNWVYCRGENSSGEVGNNLGMQSPYEAEYRAIYRSGYLTGKTIKSFSSGIYHYCAIASDDQVYCWGWRPMFEGRELVKIQPVLMTIPQ